MPSFSSIVIALVGASTAVWALPQNNAVSSQASSAGNGGSCSVGSKSACCTTSHNGVSLIDNVLGGSCLLPNLLSISNTCPGQNTYCCPVNQSGALDISLSCIPIQL